MEKTVAVNADQNVKLSVITAKNEIESEGAPKDEMNVQLESDVQALTQVKSETKINTFQRSRKSAKRFNAYHHHEPNEHSDKAISFINSQNFGWKANTCMMTKDHPERSQECDKVNLAQKGSSADEGENQASGAATRAFGEKTDDFKQALEKAQSFMVNYKSSEEIPDDELPESLDWSNFEGYDFTGDVRDQSACGSCYTMSFTQVIESRLKMKYG